MKLDLTDHEHAKGYVGTIGNRHYYHLGGFWYIYKNPDLEVIHYQKVPEEIRQKQREKEGIRFGIL